MRRMLTVAVLAAVLVGLIGASPAQATHCFGLTSSNPYEPVPKVGGVNDPHPFGYVDASGTVGFAVFTASGALGTAPGCAGWVASCIGSLVTNNPANPVPKIGGVNDPNPVGYVDATGTIQYALWYAFLPFCTFIFLA